MKQPKVAFLYGNYQQGDKVGPNTRYLLDNLPKRKTAIEYDLYWIDASKAIDQQVLNNPLIKKIFQYPENKGKDIGMWGKALKEINLDEYDYFFFSNRSGYGPTRDYWLEEFVNAFKKYSQAAVVGCVAHRKGGWHIQTWACMLKRDDLKELLYDTRAFGLKNKFFPNYFVFDTREVLISQHFLKKGRSVVCFLDGWPEIFADTDYRKYPKMIKTDPIWGEKASGIHENMTKKQNLVFIKDPERKCLSLSR